MSIKIPPTVRKWAKCPYCGAKLLIYDDTAECRGIFVKCTRGCGQEVEIVVHDGKQTKRAP